MSGVHPDRVKILRDESAARGDFILYWMQQSQRAEWNHALEYAVEQADELSRPVVVGFGLTPNYPGANSRHYDFMIRGLLETKRSLASRGIRMVMTAAVPDVAAIGLANRAAMVVCDRGYTRIQRFWRARVASAVRVPMVQVESDVVVPVDRASPKREFGAYTLRPKIRKLIDEFWVRCSIQTPRRSSLNLDFDLQELSDDPARILNELHCDQSVPTVPHILPGSAAAKARFQDFINNDLDHYDERRNDPNRTGQSGMSPYLHFGQISPLFMAMAARSCAANVTESFLEELIIRRELAINFTERCEDYDQFSCLPDWAKRTLVDHADDPREAVYSFEQLESAATHDPYWNAAQLEMVRTGKMHGYMRMYWGKKMLEWTRNPSEAFGVAVALNDKYELDGRDPNGYAGIAWCFGLHDRPWAERRVFGKIRYMNDKGLRRKFDADAYVRKVAALPEPRSRRPDRS